MKKKLRKWVILFFASMMILSVVSRVIDNVCVIKVQTDYAEGREISKTIESSGKVQGKNEIIVTAAAGLLVSKINVAKGEEVKKGEVLYEVDMADTQNLIQIKEDEIETLQLQSAEAAGQNEAAQREKDLSYQQAAENYKAAVANQEQNIQRAQQEADTAYQQLNELKGQLKDRKTEYESAVAAGDTNKSEALLNAVEELEQKVEEGEAKAAEKVQICNQTVEEQENATRTARQEMEKANVDIVQNTTARQNNLLIQQKQKELDKLREIGKSGKITAACDGLVKDVFITAGNRTIEGADLVLIDIKSGLEIVSVFTQEGKELLHKGTLVQIDTDEDKGKLNDALPVTSVRLKDTTMAAETAITAETAAAVEVKIDIPYPDILIGSVVNVCLKTESKNYPIVIKRAALHLDSSEKYYVLVLKEQETMMGKEWKAVQKEVEVIDKNEEYAAVNGVSKSDEIIVDSSRYVKDEDRVRKETE